MSVPALWVKNLNKDFSHFSLKDITFAIPVGSVVGLVGENGSGKTTCVRCILGQDIPTSGQVQINGENALENAKSHKNVGVALETCPFPEMFNASQVSRFMQDIYSNWEEKSFFDLLEQFHIPLDQPIRTFSRGMKAKLSICAILCHQANLLILDEATSGLDPIVREEILDTLADYMESHTCSILMTSHITSDLERIADFIIFLKDGKILFVQSKNELDQYGLAHVTMEQLDFIDPALILKKRYQPLYTEILVKEMSTFKKRYPDYSLDKASLDDVILMYVKGEDI